MMRQIRVPRAIPLASSAGYARCRYALLAQLSHALAFTANGNSFYPHSAFWWVQL
jgi:hypothetical protein